MNSMKNNQEIIIAKAHYDKIKNKNHGEIHVPLCSLNTSSKNKSKDHNPKAYDSASFENNRNEFDKSKWKLKGEEDDDTNCCIRNTPCPLIDFQLKKIKQLAESERPWLETNWNRMVKNSKNSEETYHDFRTYIANQKLSMLSPDHKIQLYRIGTFSNEPCHTNELQSDVYDGQAYLQKFKTFEYFSNDMPQFYGRNQRICKPLEFSVPSNFVHEIAIRYKASIQPISLQELEEKIDLEDELSCEEEFKNKNDKLFECNSNFDVDELNDVSVLSNVKESSKKLLQSQNIMNDNQNLETIMTKEEQR